MREHPNTKLIVIDTMQLIREQISEAASYSADYGFIRQVKSFANTFNLCVIIVHHTRKMKSDNSFDMISGTNGIFGGADGAFILQQNPKNDEKAFLEVKGRDIPTQNFDLFRSKISCGWELVTDHSSPLPCQIQPIIDKVSQFIGPHQPEWIGQHQN
ncbi:MAG: hypothetical protein R3Y63_05630 [Eubacteriales bacterium]